MRPNRDRATLLPQVLDAIIVTMSTCYELTYQNLDLDSPDRADLSSGNRDRRNTPCIFPTSVGARSTESEGLAEQTKNGYRDRAAYRFLNRKRRCETMPESDLAAKRLNSHAIQNCFVKNGVDIVSSCSNFCCGQLMGAMEVIKIDPTCEAEFMSKSGVFKAVRATREEIQKDGQVNNKKGLLSRMKLGFTEGMRPLAFAEKYYFPGARSTSKQEYWWRTEEGSCIQVRESNEFMVMKMMTEMLVFQVCRKAWILIHHVSEGRMSTIRKLVEDHSVA